ncbi:peptide ABC transporter substrate-binding protein [Magnetospirillum molischianum]|uniref:Oligopeptide-binding protein (Precursor) n=1 Tax=Magnetospirillum molischianum DSM 120 TaxID=1150626 RepID=H8FWY9_MAGML|nr:peptide ABC transporter substrate-binding protein [Magnetospirillum molischianum]CCG42877.1 Oligopeptide-binding protein (Precursor) [Magnetospirillum molischianum DSM 120]
MRRLFAILTLILSLAVPAAASARESLTIGISQYPMTLNPLIDSMLSKTYVLAFTRRPITAYDASWSLTCLLCETVPTIENGLARIETLPGGKKGIAVTYVLKSDAKWGDGTPVSSADIAFTWEVGRHPRSGVSNSEIFRRITRVEIHDSRRFTLHFDRVTFDFNVVNDFRPLPAHIERSRFESAPEAYRTQTAYDQDSTNPGLYNGPYRIAGFERGSYILLVRNEYWAGQRPAFDRIQIRTIENSAAMEANLLSGGIDMIAGELGLPLEQALALEKRQGNRFSFITRPSLVYEHIDLNLSSPILADRRVRRAMLAALDREGLSRQLFDGRQPIATSMVPPLDSVFAEDLPTTKYNPAAAAALLDDAGWRIGPGGIRVNAKGEKLTLELLTTAGNRSRELVAQVIQAQLRKVGIELTLRGEPARVMFGDTVTRRKFPHLAMFAWYSSPENVPRSTLHSSQIPSAENNWSGQNYPGYANPKMDALLDAIEAETDRPHRKALWRDLQQLYAEDLPSLPLYFRADPFILPKGMSGLTPTGHQDPSPYWVEQWRWD